MRDFVSHNEEVFYESSESFLFISNTTDSLIERFLYKHRTLTVFCLLFSL